MGEWDGIQGYMQVDMGAGGTDCEGNHEIGNFYQEFQELLQCGREQYITQKAGECLAVNQKRHNLCC